MCVLATLDLAWRIDMRFGVQIARVFLCRVCCVTNISCSSNQLDHFLFSFIPRTPFSAKGKINYPQCNTALYSLAPFKVFLPAVVFIGFSSSSLFIPFPLFLCPSSYTCCLPFEHTHYCSLVLPLQWLHKQVRTTRSHCSWRNTRLNRYHGLIPSWWLQGDNCSWSGHNYRVELQSICRVSTLFRVVVFHLTILIIDTLKSLLSTMATFSFGQSNLILRLRSW